MKIAVDGPLRDGDGYSTASRGVILGLFRAGALVGTENNWKCRAAWLEPEVEAALREGFSGAQAGLRLSQPDSGKLCPGDLKVCWSMWEFSEVPRASFRGLLHQPIKSWPDGMEEVDAHFVPCQHSKDLWLAAGCSKPVRVVPFGYDPDTYFWRKRDWDRPFTFIISGTLSGRKNPNMVLTCFLDLFKDSPDVRLIMKSTSHLPLRYVDYPDNVTVINENWTHDQICQLYSEADVLVYPTQGEGFGLSLIEAMATGLPAIVTGWSAPLDYMTEDVGWLLDYEMESVSSDFCLDPENEVYQQFEYAQPKEDHLKEMMVHCFDYRKEVAEKGRQAQEMVVENYNYRTVGKKILETVGGLLDGS
jgi:glycosyltransferase involved in cell wall biosynthesis